MHDRVTWPTTRSSTHAAIARRRLADAGRAREWATHRMSVTARQLLDDADIVWGPDPGDLSGHTLAAVVDGTPVTIRMAYGRPVAALLHNAEAVCTPVTSLLRHSHDRVGLRVQRDLAHALAFARATGLDHPRLLGSHGPVTITERPAGASLSAAVLEHPDRTGALLEHLWADLAATRDPDLAKAVTIPACGGRVGVEGAFGLLWHRPVPAWLDDIGTGWTHIKNRQALLDRMDWLSAGLDDHRPRDHEDRRVLVHGNLDCDHLLLAGDGTWTSSPRPH
ncbi:hypothetical protein, partial [Streptomyces sp. SID3343]|uniref:hypothetical protein n=1 Tax=Streptomyces sp. SID3343 TaxID=2690260 RepID=UPI0013714FB7